MRRLIAVIVMQGYALALACMQLRIGVRTDEAKYLLDIPYPHPPLGRFILHTLDGFVWQEMFWRIVLATIVVHAAWLVRDLVRDRSAAVRIAAMLSWLLSAAVAYQAGTIMMAPLTALQGLLFAWLLLRGRDNTADAALIGLFWLASLFTAYQAVLFAPIAMSVINRMHISRARRSMLFLLPIALLGLYTLSNPLALASMTSHAGGASSAMAERIIATLRIAGIGGGIVAMLFGGIGLLVRPRVGLVASLALTAAYVFLSPADYYAILFTPLFAAGVVLLLRRIPVAAPTLACLMPLALLLCIRFAPLASQPSVVPDIVAAIERESAAGDILIVGSFGHEWQYATSSTVRRYRDDLLSEARAVVCLEACPKTVNRPEWERLTGLSADVRVR